MKMYLAGNGAMSAKQRERAYLLLERRLLSFSEVRPGRFATSQWVWLIQEGMLSTSKERRRRER